MATKSKQVVEMAPEGPSTEAPPEASPRFIFTRNIGFEDPVDLGQDLGEIRFSRARKSDRFATYVTEDEKEAKAIREYALANPGSLIFEKIP